MEIKELNGSIQAVFLPSAYEDCLSYAKLCEYSCVFGGRVVIDKDSFVITNVFLVKQSIASYSPVVNAKEWASEIDLRATPDIANESFGFAGISKNYKYDTKVDLSKEERKMLFDSIETMYDQYIFIRVSKSGDVFVSYIDVTGNIVYYDIPWSIDTSGMGRKDADILSEIHQYTKNYSSSTTYGSTYGSTTYAYSNGKHKSIKEILPYKDSELNTKNPKLSELV